jgi:hypothetical protein
MSKIRKAVTAFAMAAAGAVVAGVVKGGMPVDAAGWFELLGAVVGVGLAAAYAVWRVPNAPALPASADDAAVRRSYR